MLFDAQQLNTIRAEFERIYLGDLDDDKAWPFVEPVIQEASFGIRTAMFTWYVNNTISEIVSRDTLVDIAARLMKTEKVRLWQDQAIWKPGTSGEKTDAGNVGFHQDYAYWQDSSTTNMVSANIVLQDVTVQNGGMRVFPGSHLLGLIAGSDNYFDTDIDSLKTKLQLTADIGEEVVLELKAGQASFHHSLLLHGSGPNTTSESRMTLAPAYMPEGTYYREEGQEPCPHSNFLGRERHHGMPFAGEFFPSVN